MKLLSVSAVALLPLLMSCVALEPLEVNHLTCEYASEPLGVEMSNPVLGWQIKTPTRNVVQTAYRVLVADSREALDANIGNCWDSEEVDSDNSIQVVYAGVPLRSASVYYWKVMVRDNQGRAAWSAPACWQMGLLAPDDWSGAQWIALEDMPVAERIVPGRERIDRRVLGKDNMLPLLRKDFQVNKPLKRATAFVSGLGQFEMSINGRKVGDHFMDPAWTQYSQYANYLTFDITSYLREGGNACGIALGNGFYRTPKERYLKCIVSYGYPKAICKLLFEYSDGTTQEVVSDTTWQAAPSPVTFSSIYGGEDYDARLLQQGWDKPGFDGSSWKRSLAVSGHALRSQTSTPLKVCDTLRVASCFLSQKGNWVYDFGQNFSGIVRLSVKGARGQALKLWPGELLNDDSTACQQASGTPYWWGYTSGGDSCEHWQPQFTYYGLRYLMLEDAVPEGAPNPKGLPVVTAMKGLHTCNSATQTGSFTSSDELFNRIFGLIDWSIRSNLSHVLTDCPHREKLGWLEVTHLMMGAIAYNYDIRLLYEKIVHDMAVAQLADGMVPDIAPEYVIFGGGFRDSPEWGSASVIVPWYLYKWYGDERPLREFYPMMKRYEAYLASKAQNYIVSHGLGDWYDLGPKDPGYSQLTSAGVTATAMFYYNAKILQQTASMLGKQEDEKHFANLSGKIKKSFNKKYFHADSLYYDRNSQTANSIALFMGLVAPEHRQAVFTHIIDNLKARDYSQTTGEIGFHYFLKTLEDWGATEAIYTINHRNDVPGYGFQLAKGATSLTESWAALRYVSNNHCMLGHLMEWFYSGLVGIRMAGDDVAFHKIVIAPQPVGDITSAAAVYESRYGAVSARWDSYDGEFRLSVEIPANTTALLYFPQGDLRNVQENGAPFNGTIVTDANGRSALQVGSGEYVLQVATE